MHRMKGLLKGLVVLVLVGGCRSGPSSGQAPGPATPGSGETAAVPSVDLTVLAAASLAEPFTAIGEHFEAAHPGVTVSFSFGASSDLATQILEGAPADAYASANARQMARLVEAGEVEAGAEQTFARNRLVVVYPRDNPAGLAALQDLARPGVKLVLAAKAVPAGDYALQFLARASEHPDYTAAYSQTVLANVVSYEDDVRGVLGKVELGEADAGIVYVSDVAGARGEAVGRIEIPDDLNVVASYPIAPTARSPRADWARRFVDFVLSAEGQAVLAEHGFESDGHGADDRP